MDDTGKVMGVSVNGVSRYKRQAYAKVMEISISGVIGYRKNAR
jgi:hypothetical protein